MSVGASMIPGVGAETQILGMSASATNVGNRTINITYLGYAIKKDGRYNITGLMRILSLITHIIVV